VAASLRRYMNNQEQSTQSVSQSENALTQFSNRISENALDMLAYHQISPLMMLDEQDCRISFPANTQSPKTDKINHNQLAVAYYKIFSTNLHPLLCSLKMGGNIDNVLKRSKTLTLLSKLEIEQDTLIVPTFSPLGCVGIFMINIERLQLASPIDAKGLIGQVLMEAQACHVKVCRAQAKQNAETVRLTDRERQILCWVARGKSNGVIADILGISVHTVTGYMRNIYLKTHTNDRTSATMLAIQQGVLHKSPNQGDRFGIAV